MIKRIKLYFINRKIYKIQKRILILQKQLAWIKKHIHDIPISDALLEIHTISHEIKINGELLDKYIDSKNKDK